MPSVYIYKPTNKHSMWDLFNWTIIRWLIRVSIKEEVRVIKIEKVVISQEITVKNKTLKVTKTHLRGIAKETLIIEEKVEIIVFEKSIDKILQII